MNKIYQLGKAALIILFIILQPVPGFSQVAINTTGNEASPSAMLDVSSSEKGLLIPRMTQEQRDAIQNPTTGLLIYQTDYTQGFYYYYHGTWKRLSAEGDSWGLKGNAGTNPYQNFIGTTDANDLNFKVNNKYKLTLTQKGQLETHNTGSSVFIGENAGENDDLTYKYNVFIGTNAGYQNISGKNNSVIGYYSLNKNITGDYNSAFGSYALVNNTTGNRNSGFGVHTLHSNLTGESNAAFGNYAMYQDTSGSYNTAMGNNALYYNLKGNYNVAIGSFSLLKSEGERNVALGTSSLTALTTGNNNIGIGYRAGNNQKKGSNNIIIGYDIYTPVDTADYQLNIGNLLFANNMDGYHSIISSGNVGIGVKNPSAKLEVAGQIKITGGNPGSGKWLYSDADGLASWETLPGGNHVVLYDADSNTLIQVEKNSNEDKIRFDLGGTEYFVFNEGRIEVKNTHGTVTIGENAGSNTASTAGNNVFMGSYAGNQNSSGFSNVAIGSGALYSGTNKSNLVAIGDSALYHNGENATGTYDGLYNTAVGSKALFANNTAFNNTALGFWALKDNTANFNTAVGAFTLKSNIDGAGNTALGSNALVNHLHGDNNTALGQKALLSSETGSDNIAIGYLAGSSVTNGANNIIIGNEIGVSSSDSNKLNIGNVIFGTDIYGSSFPGKIGIGVRNPTARLEVNGQVKITGGNPGDGKVLQSNADGLASWEELTIIHDELYDTDSNTLIQVEKNSNEDKIRFDLGGTEYFVFNKGRMEVKNTGSSVFIGNSAGSSDDLTSNLNVFIGEAAGHSNTSGSNNTALGYTALYTNVSGNNNTALGSGSLVYNTGNGNSAVGTNSLRANTSGTQNIAFGYYALPANTTGYNNSALGTSSLFSNTTGHQNTAIGSFSMNSNTTGSKNCVFGEGSLINNTTGNQNIAIGYSVAQNLTTGSNNIIIGSGISTLSASGSNTLNIGNIIYANNMDGVDSTISTGNIGIGVKNPTARLEVNGQVKITGGNPGDGKVLQCNADGLASWETLPADIDIHDELYDADSNTLIQVEKNSNEDKIRFDLGGTEYFVFDEGRIAVKNTGNSVFIGEGAGLNDNLVSNNNTFVGYMSGATNTDGTENVALGYYSLKNCTGSRNTAFGENAGSNITSGWYNIMIGYNVQPTSSLASSQLNIGNIIYGTGISLTNPKIGIGTSNPTEKLDVLGNFRVKQTSSSVYANIESTTAGASLYLKAAGSSLAQIKFYDNGSYGGSMGYDNDEDRIFFYHHGNIFVKDGNLLPGSHKGSDLGLNGMAWDDIYYDDLFNQGAAAFVNRDVISEIVNHPPKAKKAGSFDDKTDRGEAELDPVSLPDGLHENNAILTDELTTYNYKTNYEQQLLINAQEKTIRQQQQTISELQQKLSEMEKLKQRLDKIEKLISEKE